MVDVSKLVWSAEGVSANLKLIDAEINRLKAELTAAGALKKANQELCAHKGRTSYYDPRDGGGGHCPTCDKYW
jgi:hypothetical protein